MQTCRRGWGAELRGWGQQITGEATAAMLVCPSTLDRIPRITAQEAEPGFWKPSTAGLCRCHQRLPVEPVPVHNPGCQHRAILPLLHNKSLIGFISH